MFRLDITLVSTTLAICVLSVCTTYAQGTGGDNNCPSELDAADFSDSKIFRVSDFNKNEKGLRDGALLLANITEESIKKCQTTGTTAAGSELQDYINQSSSRPPVDNQGQTDDSYEQMCPIKWVLLPRTKYYIAEPVKHDNASGRTTFTYLFPYADTWIADCPVKYCTLNYDRSNPYDFRYRCFKEYRNVWTWVLKVDILQFGPESDLTEVVFKSKKFLPLRLPRNCVCKRYAPWLVGPEQCPRSDD